MKEKCTWGILGCARIARKCIIPAFAEAQHASLTGIASRNRERAKQWANDFNIPRFYATYDDLLADKQVDAVYIPLPNSLHLPWVKAAARAGKHILCEKPMSVNAAEAKQMLDVAKENNVLLHEAFMWRFHPRTQKIFELVKQRVLGDIRLIRGCFSYQMSNDPNIRLDPELAGGALMDVGCYCVNFCRLMLQTEPKQVSAMMQWQTHASGKCVDTATSALMEFPGSIMAMFSSRFDSAYDGQWMEIVGSKGRLWVDAPFNPPSGNLSISLNDNLIACENANHFQLELDAFSLAVLKKKSVHGLIINDDPYYQARTIEALYQSAKDQRVVEILR